MRRPPCAKWYKMMNTSPPRILAEEMKKLKDLAEKSLATHILDYEAYGSEIREIFQRVKEATVSFLVRSIILI